jgi:hypothetical protein
VRKKFLARLREDRETVAVKCGFDERDFRMQADPGTFFTTDHYRGYPTVLIRMASVDPEDLRDVLELAWRRSAPKRLVAKYDAQHESLKGPARARSRPTVVNVSRCGDAGPGPKDGR